MESSQRLEAVLNTVALTGAVFCADCEIISDSPGEICSVCGSRSLLDLERVLGGSLGQQRAIVVAENEIPLRRMFPLTITRRIIHDAASGARDAEDIRDVAAS